VRQWRGGFVRWKTEPIIIMRLSLQARRDVEHHGRETYPAECCGFLIGRRHAEGAAHRVHRLENVHPSDRRHRYAIDPLAWLRVERELSPAEAVVAVYHSHPDRPPVPSEADREAADPGLSYVIVSLRRGEVEAMRAWRLCSRRRMFDEESVDVL